jgi:hypothetical protein
MMFKMESNLIFYKLILNHVAQIRNSKNFFDTAYSVKNQFRRLEQLAVLNNFKNL